MRILIADDSPVMCKLLKALLDKQDHEVTVTGNGVEAFEILKNPDAPHLALVDWMMPELDGIETVKKIRSVKKDISTYIILVTAKSEIGDIVEGLDAGANDYITKPYNKKELLARIKVGKRVIDLQKQLKQARDEYKFEAMHDHLTQIMNRMAILDILEKEIARAQRNYFDLLVGMFDIDHFKKVNDIYGHKAGDEVLKGVVKSVKDNLRSYDFLGRYGGEEFLIVLPEANEKISDNMFDRIRENVARNPIKTSEGEISVTISVGVTEWQEDVTKVIEMADHAMYQAKTGGRNRVEFHDEFKAKSHK